MAFRMITVVTLTAGRCFDVAGSSRLPNAPGMAFPSLFRGMLRLPHAIGGTLE